MQICRKYNEKKLKRRGWHMSRKSTKGKKKTTAKKVQKPAEVNAKIKEIKETKAVEVKVQETPVQAEKAEKTEISENRDIRDRAFV